MALTDAPEIRIDGVAVASSWSDTGRIGLEGIKMTWGRSSHLDRADPGQMYCELIDPRAHLDGYESLTGKSIEVWRAGDEANPPRRIFNGRIDDYDVEIRWISDPHTFERRRVWVLSISASDKLAELAKAVLPGPNNVDIIVDAVGPSYWGYIDRLAQSGVVRPAQHVAQMMEQGADKIVSAIDWRDPDLPSEPVVSLIPWSDKRSLLDLIEGLYAMHPLAYPIYEPSSNSVLIGQPAVGPAIELHYADNTIAMRVGDDVGYAIPASKVVVPDGYKAGTGADESIDVVQVVQQSFEISIDENAKASSSSFEAVTEHLIDGYDPEATGRREHRIDVDVLFEYQNPGGGGAGIKLPDSITFDHALGGQVTITGHQIDNAYRMLEIARDLFSPPDVENATLIAFITCLVEAPFFDMYANSNVPESLTYPHDKVGSDNESLGLFQQQTVWGWGSTEQLMDVDHNIYAFYGGPGKPQQEGTPGLRDINWKSYPTLGEAAQAVQGSAFPDRYNDWISSARVIYDALKDVGDDDEPGGPYTWPFSLDNVTSEYGWREWSQSFHEGIDFSYPGIGGAAIHPVGPGTVKTILVDGAGHGWGNGVIVDHGHGLESLYAHMPSTPPVVVGSIVDQGTVIGYVGHTGNSFGDHLHMETWRNGQHMNPRSWMEQFGGGTISALAEGDPLGRDIAEKIAVDTADALAQLRGAATMPTLRLDWRNFEYDYPITYGWLDTSCKQVPVYFPGSVFADLLDVSRVHQFIGGTLVYADGGWTHDLEVAPALIARSGITVDELVTTDAPLMGQYAADITIADLGNVHEGIH